MNTLKTTIIFTLLFSSMAFGQIRVNEVGATYFPNSSAAIDLSSIPNGNTTPNLLYKGIVFPETDLTLFTSFTNAGLSGIGSNFPTNFDGTLVYNTGIGNAALGDDGNGNPLAVSPGFYYYKNNSRDPDGANFGRWIPITDGENLDLSLSGNILSLTNDTTPVDLSPFEESAEIADVQNNLNIHIAADGDLSSSNELNTSFEVNGSNLELTDAGGTKSVPLTGLGSDDQNLTSAILNGNTLTINIENGDPVSVDLSSLSGGNTVGSIGTKVIPQTYITLYAQTPAGLPSTTAAYGFGDIEFRFAVTNGYSNHLSLQARSLTGSAIPILVKTEKIQSTTLVNGSQSSATIGTNWTTIGTRWEGTNNVLVKTSFITNDAAGKAFTIEWFYNRASVTGGVRYQVGGIISKYTN